MQIKLASKILQESIWFGIVFPHYVDRTTSNTKTPVGKKQQKTKQNKTKKAPKYKVVKKKPGGSLVFHQCTLLPFHLSALSSVCFHAFNLCTPTLSLKHPHCLSSEHPFTCASCRAYITCISGWVMARPATCPYMWGITKFKVTVWHISCPHALSPKCLCTLSPVCSHVLSPQAPFHLCVIMLFHPSALLPVHYWALSPEHLCVLSPVCPHALSLQQPFTHAPWCLFTCVPFHPSKKPKLIEN